MHLTGFPLSRLVFVQVIYFSHVLPDNGRSEVIFRGKRDLEPIDIYLLIFGSDIDEWKEQEENTSQNETVSASVLIKKMCLWIVFVQQLSSFLFCANRW